jgi:hypothetical protein
MPRESPSGGHGRAGVAIPGVGRMPARNDLKRLAAAVDAAEREFHAARGRKSLNAAIRWMMRAKADLRAAQAARSMASCVEAVERLQGREGASISAVF